MFLLVSVHLIFIWFYCCPLFPPSVFIFHCLSHSLSLPSSSSLGCIPLPIGLPFLRNLLRKMCFLPYAYYVVVFVSFAFAFVCFFCFLFLCILFLTLMYPFLATMSFLCCLLSCPFHFVCFPYFFLGLCSRLDLIWFRLSCDHAGSVDVR